MVEQLKQMKMNLVNCVQAQMANLKEIDSKELGEAIDMIKDLEEALYYCTITKSMEESGKKEHEYNQEREYPVYYRNDRMSYPMNYNMGGGNGSSMSYPMNYNMGYQDGNRQMPGESRNYPIEMRDYREGRSPMTRRSYMESKEMHKDTRVKMQELDKYMQELSHDVVEMIEGATPEEKQLLQQKLNMLATKVK